MAYKIFQMEIFLEAIIFKESHMESESITGPMVRLIKENSLMDSGKVKELG